MKLSHLLLGSTLVAAAVASTGDAQAQAKKKPEVFEIGPIMVTARPTRPSAVVELGKILPEIEIEKIRQPFISKIEEALAGDPF
ncbi:MAG: hypothetical protein JST00_43920 [Deltaproteobacteria bacterium]|nr:hypothetical protein [Deltaproteobacteria bacterium]